MEYFTLLTQKGSEKIAAATAANTTVNLTYIALGDGKGTVPMPDASKTALVNEVYRAPLNDLRVDEQNANWLVAEGYVPSDEGNFWVREVGIFDSDGDLIIIGNYPETFKPITSNGVAKDLYMKVITEVSSADAVTLQVDPSVVMASQEYVNERLENYALITGDKNKKFNVANATADNEAINKKQLEDTLLNFTEGGKTVLDADTQFKSGLFRVNNDTNGIPIEKWGGLVVTGDDGGVNGITTQIYINYLDGSLYTRSHLNIGWTPWKKTITNDMFSLMITDEDSGYLKIPTDNPDKDFIYQWGHHSSNAGHYDIVFPLAFPNSCRKIELTATATQTATNYNFNNQWVNTKEKTGFSYTKSSNQTIGWTAIGD